MNKEHILAILYDMALVIGGEVKLQPLLIKTLQRLLYHTGFPCGMIFLEVHEKTAAAGNVESLDLILDQAIGDYGLTGHIGKIVTVPALLLQGEAAVIEVGDLLKTMPCRQAYYTYALRLPIDGCGVILLLSPALPYTDIPLTQIFQPVMSNLAKAILLCRHNEAYTGLLLSERKLAEENLIESEDRLHTLIDALPDAIFFKDGEGRWLVTNPAAKTLF